MFIAEHGGHDHQHPHEIRDTKANQSVKSHKANTFLVEEVPTECSPRPAAALEKVSGV